MANALTEKLLTLDLSVVTDAIYHIDSGTEAPVGSEAEKLIGELAKYNAAELLDTIVELTDIAGGLEVAAELPLTSKDYEKMGEYAFDELAAVAKKWAEESSDLQVGDEGYWSVTDDKLLKAVNRMNEISDMYYAAKKNETGLKEESAVKPDRDVPLSASPSPSAAGVSEPSKTGAKADRVVSEGAASTPAKRYIVVDGDCIVDTDTGKTILAVQKDYKFSSDPDSSPLPTPRVEAQLVADKLNS